MVDEDVRVRHVDVRASGRGSGNWGAGDPEAVGQRLQLAVPLFSQNMQKWLPSTKSMSMMFLAVFLQLGGFVLHDHAPSVTVCAQAAWMRPLTRTVQTRQLPWGTRFLYAHSRGM